MLRKSGIVLSSNSNIQSLCSGQFGTSSSSDPKGRLAKQQHRPYAIIPDGYSRHQHDGHRWPEVTSVNAIPTPYQIFNQKKGSPYSKQKFYELVKIYHPDRHYHDVLNRNLSYSTKLERYRLIIAANNILSDPVKRGAYDRYGAGWNGQPDVTQPESSSEPSQNGGRGWAGGPNGPSQNATWEDWEKWYQRDASGPQEPTFVSNSTFVTLIVILAAIGGLGQASRLSNYSLNFIERTDALHHRMSKELKQRRRQTTIALGSKEERIQRFLKQRDQAGYGFVDSQEEQYMMLLSHPEVCSSADIERRRLDIHHKGANQGIGFETAKNLLLYSESYHILIGSRDPQKGSDAVSALQSLPIKGTVSSVQLDVTNDSSVDSAATHIAETYNRLDILVNNAGIYSQNPVLRDAFREILAVNVVGVLSVTEAFLPLLRKSTAPRLIFVSSSTGSISQAFDPNSKYYSPAAIDYRASKAALNMLMVQYWVRLGKEGFKVLGADPGLTATNFFRPLRPGAVEPEVGGERIAAVVRGERDEDMGRVCGEYGVSPF
ncbi:hypothetical protein B7494_g1803 [Chlorociboria aeruginascens]|nr:hypothetical protein B7494_g1803 [Chlorociboria aeruginascens]